MQFVGFVSKQSTPPHQIAAEVVSEFNLRNLLKDRISDSCLFSNCFRPGLAGHVGLMQLLGIILKANSAKYPQHLQDQQKKARASIN